MTQVNAGELTSMITQAHNPSRKIKRARTNTDASGTSSHQNELSASAAPQPSEAPAAQTRPPSRSSRGLLASAAVSANGGDGTNEILFPSTMEAYRALRRSQSDPNTQPSQSAPRRSLPISTMAQVSNIATSSGVAGHISSASRTRWQEHQRRLNQVSNLLGATRKPTKTSSVGGIPSWRKNALGKLMGVIRRQTPTSHQPSSLSDDPDVIGEFDRDVSEAMVTIGGRFVGLNPDELMHSQGLRKLVARNIRWFQNTPDWLKLIGLVVAKRLNSAVRTSVSVFGNNSDLQEDVHRIKGLDVVVVPVQETTETPPPAVTDVMELDETNNNTDLPRGEIEEEVAQQPLPMPVTKKEKPKKTPKPRATNKESKEGEEPEKKGIDEDNNNLTSFF